MENMGKQVTRFHTQLSYNHHKIGHNISCIVDIDDATNIGIASVLNQNYIVPSAIQATFIYLHRNVVWTSCEMQYVFDFAYISSALHQTWSTKMSLLQIKAICNS